MRKTTSFKKSHINDTDDIVSFRADTLDIFSQFPNKNFFFLPSPLNGQREFDISTTIDYFDKETKELSKFTTEYTERPSSYLYKIIFKINGVSCFEYHEGTQKSANILTRNMVTITGSAWRVLGEDEVIRIYEENFNFEGFKRLDLALDVPYSLSSILKYFPKLKQTGANFYGSQGQSTTHYIGAYAKKDNRYKLIRLYDKILSIKKKKQQELYPNYLEYAAMTRIEIEFREELCKFITWEQFLDYQWTIDLFCTHIGKHTSIFSELQQSKITLKRAQKSVDLSELTPEQIMTSQAVKMFKGLAYSLLKAGICPVKYLQDNNLQKQLTSIDIENIF